MRSVYRLALALVLVSVLVLSAMPSNTSAFPYKLQGYLKDENGVPITLANVSISGDVYDMNVQDMVPQTYYRTTDEFGYYVIWIAANEPGGFFLNSSVTVSYGTGDDAVSKTVKLEGLGTWANLTYQEPFHLIPVLTSPLGVLVIVILVSAVIVGYFILRVEKPEGETESSDEEKPVKTRRRRQSR